MHRHLFFRVPTCNALCGGEREDDGSDLLWRRVAPSGPFAFPKCIGFGSGLGLHRLSCVACRGGALETLLKLGGLQQMRMWVRLQMELTRAPYHLNVKTRTTKY